MQPRHLARVQTRLAEAGLTAFVGHELEFVLVGPDGARLPTHLWSQYGLAGVLEHEGFVHDVMAAAAVAGVDIEQFHPEYGQNQFEISLRPQSPVPAADHLMLLRIIVSRVARRFGLRVSLSPVPFAGGVGSGAHQHFSLFKDAQPVFSGGSGPYGLTDEGQHAIAGLLAGLPDAQGILAGSILSGMRMQPGQWAGAFVCWGAENREAAVRLLVGDRPIPTAPTSKSNPLTPRPTSTWPVRRSSGSRSTGSSGRRGWDLRPRSIRPCRRRRCARRPVRFSFPNARPT